MQETLRMARRLFFIQSMLNLRTLQGPGYLFILWPWLKTREYRNEEVMAAADYMNCHPVMASLAAGALRKRLESGDALNDPAGLSEWQMQISGPLGLIGDALIWDRWKPLIFALGVLIMLWFPNMQLWGGIAAGLLLLYNIPLWQVRRWGVRTGYEKGERVLDALSHPLIGKLRSRLAIAGAILAGLLISTALLRANQGSVVHVSQFIVALAVGLFGVRRQWSILWTLLLALMAAICLPLFIGWISNFI